MFCHTKIQGYLLCPRPELCENRGNSWKKRCHFSPPERPRVCASDRPQESLSGVRLPAWEANRGKVRAGRERDRMRPLIRWSQLITFSPPDGRHSSNLWPLGPSAFTVRSLIEGKQAWVYAGHRNRWVWGVRQLTRRACRDNRMTYAGSIFNLQHIWQTRQGGKKTKNDNNIFFSVSVCWHLRKRLNAKCICSSKHNFDPCSKLSIPQAVKHLLSPGWHVKKGRSVTPPDTDMKEVLARQNWVAFLHIHSIIIPLKLHITYCVAILV